MEDTSREIRDYNEYKFRYSLEIADREDLE